MSHLDPNLGIQIGVGYMAGQGWSLARSLRLVPVLGSCRDKEVQPKRLVLSPVAEAHRSCQDPGLWSLAGLLLLDWILPMERGQNNEMHDPYRHKEDPGFGPGLASLYLFRRTKMWGINAGLGWCFTWKSLQRHHRLQRWCQKGLELKRLQGYNGYRRITQNPLSLRMNPGKGRKSMTV